MTIAIRVEGLNGKYTASVLGQQQISASGGTLDEAVSALRATLLPQVASGELSFLDLEPQGIAALAGKYKNDPGWHAMWDEIEEEAYRHREELKAREFPE